MTLCTRGGNRSWSGAIKLLDPARYDHLFVLVGDGRRWFIPSGMVDGGSVVRLGGPKYAAYEIERGLPLQQSAPTLDSAAARRGSRAVKGTAL